jgi:steroid delta-isomerase-like uncharacterized protein
MNVCKIDNMKNRRWVASLLILLATIGLSYGQKENSGNLKLAQAWIKNLSVADTVALANMYADTARIESPNWTSSKTGGAAIREIYCRYFTTSPDLTHSVSSIFTNDNTIVIEYISSGTMVNLEKDSPEYMRGKKYTLKNCTRMNVTDGRITGQASYFDQVAFLRQVGFFDQK